jgi:hypothetical protein
MAKWGKEILRSFRASDKYSAVIGGSGQCKTNLPRLCIGHFFRAKRKGFEFSWAAGKDAHLEEYFFIKKKKFYLGRWLSE